MNEIERLPEYTQFRDALERMKRIEGETTYWMARDIQQALGYATWERFEELINRARMTCESAGVNPDNQFHPAAKMVEIGSGATRETADWFLSRYACYLIAMNGEATKREIAFAKTYFAVQTFRQEIADAQTQEEKRLQLRNRVKDANRNLNSAAKVAGVQNYAFFHDAGYKGLYGGLGKTDIEMLKKIPPGETLLDCIDRAELAANEFRITQTEQKLIRDEVRGQRQASETHFRVGDEVRQTIKKIGGTMPEALPDAQPIKKLIARRKKALKSKSD